MHQNQIELVREISHLLQKGVNEEDTYSAIFRIIEKTLPVETGTLYLFNPENNHLEKVYQFGNIEVNLAEAVHIGVGIGLTGWIAKQEEPIVLSSLSKARPGRDNLFRSFLSLPLRAEGKLIGVLNLATSKEGSYLPEYKGLYKEVAIEISFILNHLLLQVNFRKQNEKLRTTIQELQKLQQQLIEKERLAAIGALIVTVNHEINNPLTSIMGMAEVLDLTLEKVSIEKVRQGLRGIIREAKRIQEVTHKLANLKNTKTLDYLNGEKMLSINPDDEHNSSG